MQQMLGIGVFAPVRQHGTGCRAGSRGGAVIQDARAVLVVLVPLEAHGTVTGEGDSECIDAFGFRRFKFVFVVIFHRPAIDGAEEIQVLLVQGDEGPHALSVG